MNPELDRLAAALDLAGCERLRLAFGHACTQRLRHLLEQPEVDACVAAFGEILAGRAADGGLPALAERAARLANAHAGSRSIDGCGHAAVSASYAVAKALQGRAIEAANYAAYAIVYAQGGYGAVGDRASFAPEFEWQLRTLAELAARQGEAHSDGQDPRTARRRS